ncbi:CheR family methyltransferase [Spiribacter halobius]|uniref:protein-glutamate O-methyltransferase n=1 Tax=Sediminicurvatus halobius TaxID=2182432 RepID=A0A2U2MYA6_9GAMM|nr:protein-glutamate O-methyltransferase CheR [Spiribacter halobius]PWG61991.1 methyltransferase [Spiribacter halobius]UEX78398.1 protein-glutamate O-methyltransferase CheR [Spiribacter halobius]
MAEPLLTLPAEPAAMSDAEFDVWAELLRERTGMRLARERRSFLITALAARMAERGFEDRAAYYAHLRAGAVGQLEWAALVDRLTVQETRFYRDAASLDWLRGAGLPALLSGLPPATALQAWSAGCATGEEAYTLAMLLDEALAGTGRYFGVTGSDLSLRALARARRGEFPARRLAPLPTEWRERYCEPLPGERYQVCERLRARTCFLQNNLLEPASSPLPAMHLIVCQNVLIYFDRPRREQLLAELARRLQPGGLLVLGAGELSRWRPAGLERVAQDHLLIFRRRADATVAPAAGTRA